MGSDISRPTSIARIRKLASGVVLAGVLSLGASTCTGGGGEDQAAQDTLTRRQKDSIISTLPVPGAGAVGKALEASDAARARAELHDTIG